MNGCCLLVLFGDFLGSDIHLLLIFGIRIEAKIFLLSSRVLLGLASCDHNGNEIIKDNLKTSADGIRDEVEEGKSCLTDLRILLDSKQLVNSLHSSHDICLVESLAVAIFRLAEDIRQFT